MDNGLQWAPTVAGKDAETVSHRLHLEVADALGERSEQQDARVLEETALHLWGQVGHVNYFGGGLHMRLLAGAGDDQYGVLVLRVFQEWFVGLDDKVGPLCIVRLFLVNIEYYLSLFSN